MSLRKLRLYIDLALPQDSAAHRAATEGQTWTWNERLLWMLIRRVEENTVIVGKSLGQKKLKLAKTHPEFPWAEADDGTTVIGDRGGHDSEDVMAFLNNLPGGGVADG